MNQYILDARYATENLIKIMLQERKSLEEKISSRKMMSDAEKKLFESMKKSGFTIEGWIELYELSRAAKRFDEEASEMVKLVNSLGYSLNIIAGAVIQVAKQGISFVHGSLVNCPDGRFVGQESLKNIVWQARNQAMHFEDGSYNVNVVRCFQNLEIDHGLKFRLGNTNLAYEVVMLLGWTSYTSYENDLALLLP